MDVKVYPSALSGKIQAPPSKSAAHRGLICAALASLASGAAPACRVWPIQLSQDMQAARSGLSALGCEVEEAFSRDGTRSWLVRSGGHPKEEVHCGESASAFRFFLPILAALGRDVRFTGAGKLPERPMEPLFSLLESHGVRCEHPHEKSLPLTLSGHLESGEFSIGGDLSSQYITGLLFALPLLCQDSRIRLTSELESAPYVEMTLRQLEQAQITVRKTKEGFFIPGGQRYRGKEFPVEGDYSNSAFFLCGAAVAGWQGEAVGVEGLSIDSCQGDKKIIELLSQMGAVVSQSDEVVVDQNVKAAADQSVNGAAEPGMKAAVDQSLNGAAGQGMNEAADQSVNGAAELGMNEAVGQSVNVAAGQGMNGAAGRSLKAGRTACFTVKRGQLQGMEIDLRDIPDLGPILAVLGAYAKGKTTLFNAGRLRLKESDRLSSMNDGLRKMGADIVEFPDRLVILGKEKLAGGCEVSSANDHRIAMGLAIAALGCEKPVVIRQAECVSKSYPHFFEELNRLGGKTDVVNLG